MDLVRCASGLRDDSDGYGRAISPGGAAPADHGLGAKLQEQDCTTCHAADLTGATGPSCDSCHAPGWRTTCTFCHGDADRDATGAPPQDIDDNTDIATISFPPHLQHVLETGLHRPFDCTECHVKPVDILSPGHIFVGDASSGQAEVAFGALNPVASFSGTSCSNLYCHGDGQGSNGSIAIDAGPRDCASCHPSISSGENAWEKMSGDHEDHLKEGLQCAECHPQTTLDNKTIVDDPAFHVNGMPDVDLPGNMTRAGNTCTGSCHGENHAGRTW